MEPYQLSTHLQSVNLSAGVVAMPRDGTDPVLLLQALEPGAAECARRRHRQLGRVPSRDRQGRRLPAVDRGGTAHVAFERGDFDLYYQPKVDMEKRPAVTGVEALIRWNNAERGSLLPWVFIPLMEETGMIVPVGAWVLRQAAEERGKWRQMGLVAPLRRGQCLDLSSCWAPRLCRQRRSSLRAEGLAGEVAPGIDIEVTETMIMQDDDRDAGS